MLEAKRKSRRARKNALDDEYSSFARVKPSTLHRPINDAVRPCLIEITYLGLRDRKPPPDVAYTFAREHLTRVKANLEALTIPPEDARDIFYALVAFTDEIMQLDPGPLKEFWQAHLLQLEYFGETRAGEGFFEHLERIKAEGRMGVLRVYHLCLLFGFHGIYAHHGELERENLMDSIKQRLGDNERAILRQPLSPHGTRPDEPGTDRERNILLQWLAGATAIMAVVWYIGILFTVDAQERSLGEALQRAYEDLKLGVVASAP